MELLFDYLKYTHSNRLLHFLKQYQQKCNQFFLFDKNHQKLEAKALPEDLDYKSIKGLRLEAAQKLASVKPLTVGQASRISGVNPADISVLLIYLGLK